MEQATVFTCEHPVRIRNIYTGEIIYVPCRKCAMCRKKKQAEMTARLNIEASCHPYVLFGTLTYAPEYLPYMEIDWNNRVLRSDSACFSMDDDLKYYLDKDSYEYLNVKKCLPVFRVEDCQKFIKKVRERIRTNSSGESLECRYLRYFLVGEIGETLYRPHYHFIFYTASKWFAEHAKSVVADCWSYGRGRAHKEKLGITDCQHVKNSASSYVSSYLNCPDGAPKIYSFRRFRPFYLSSKHPPIGSMLTSSEEIQNLFFSGSPTRTMWNEREHEFLQVPIPRSLCSRLYPKVRGFDEIPYHSLLELYGFAKECISDSFEDFKSRIHDEVEFWNRNSFGVYLSKYLKWNESSKDDSTLHSLLSVLKRFEHQRRHFGISTKDYLDRIIRFYSDRESLFLKYQVSWQEYISDNPLGDFKSDFLLVDLELVCTIREELKGTDNSNVLRLIFKKYGIFDIDDPCAFKLKLMDSDFTHDVLFQQKSDIAHKVMSDGKNKHLKWEYLNRVFIEKELRDFLIYFNNKKENGYI